MEKVGQTIEIGGFRSALVLTGDAMSAFSYLMYAVERGDVSLDGVPNNYREALLTAYNQAFWGK